MDNNLLKEEDLEGLLEEISLPEDNSEMSEEMKASQRRVEEYIVKNMENQ